MLNVVYNSTPALLPKWIMILSCPSEKDAANCLCGEFLHISQILKPKCTTGTDHSALAGILTPASCL